MKKLVIITFIFLVSNCLYLLAAPFTKTKEEEILELVTVFYASYPDQNLEDLYTQVRDYGVGPQFMPLSTLLNQENLVGIEAGEYIAKYNLIPDTLATFNALKQLMGIPEEVELWIENVNYDKPAHYNPLYRRIEIMPSFFSHSPTERLFTFIHELTHVLQHQEEGLLNFNKPTAEKAFEHERQADCNAAQAISCPICFQMIINQAFRSDEFMKENNFHEEGYLLWQDLQKYQNQKSWQDLCDVHAVNNAANRELRAAIITKNVELEGLFHNEIKECESHLKLDFETSRLMQGRLSSIKLQK